MRAVEKYETRVESANSLLCVGLDSDVQKLPARFLASESPQWVFNRHIIDATAQYTAAFKINIAFYESEGADGWRQLERTMAYLHERHPNILRICDAKRGDIGNTSAAYARAIFDALGFDAVTLNPYLGRDALQPFLEYKDRACIILCRTSNPGSAELQNLRLDGRPLWKIVAEKVACEWNEYGNCMLVASGKNPTEVAQIRAIVGKLTLLVPGIGAQGGDAKAAIEAGLNREKGGLIINSSRGIIFADDPARAARSLRDTINMFRSA